jgi:hypothetical protein
VVQSSALQSKNNKNGNSTKKQVAGRTNLNGTFLPVLATNDVFKKIERIHHDFNGLVYSFSLCILSADVWMRSWKKTKVQNRVVASKSLSALLMGLLPENCKPKGSAKLERIQRTLSRRQDGKQELRQKTQQTLQDRKVK